MRGVRNAIATIGRRTTTPSPGVPIPSGCRQGSCGTCATRLLGGNDLGGAAVTAIVTSPYLTQLKELRLADNPIETPEDMYGKKMSNRDVVLGTVKAPSTAARLIAELNKQSSRRASE